MPKHCTCHTWSGTTAEEHEPNHDGDGLTDYGCTVEGCYCEGPGDCPACDYYGEDCLCPCHEDDYCAYCTTVNVETCGVHGNP